MANFFPIQSKHSQPIWTTYEEEERQSAATFETAYHIARYIRSTISASGGSFSDIDLQGPPNDFWIQTKKGLVIEEEWGIPSIIHTPLGVWQILYCTSGNFRNFSKIFEVIKKHLNLQPINGPCAYGGSMLGGPRLWAVMKWNDQELEEPIYRRRSPDRNFLPKNVVDNIWKEFCKRHRDVKDPFND
jgi:hypothetical protein